MDTPTLIPGNLLYLNMAAIGFSQQGTPDGGRGATQHRFMLLGLSNSTCSTDTEKYRDKWDHPLRLFSNVTLQCSPLRISITTDLSHYKNTSPLIGQLDNTAISPIGQG